MVKIIVEVTYDFYANTIRRDNNVQIVTSENEKSYYCRAIGTSFRKDKEKKVQCIIDGVVPYLSVFKTLIIKDKYFNKETNKLDPIILYAINGLNTELVEIMKEELKGRLERIEII